MTILSPRTRTSNAGDTEVDWSSPIETASIGLVQSRASSGNDLDRHRQHETGRVYLPHDAPIASGYRVRCDGLTWQVVGPPRLVRDNFGPHHLEVTIERETG